MNIHHSELLKLKNLGVASVNILHAVGINTFTELQKVGAVEAYRRIKGRDINVSKVMLYALEGALLDIHWNDLTPDMKLRLVNQAEQSSYQGSEQTAVA
jgi:DNA transformation protein and related proteins